MLADERSRTIFWEQLACRMTLSTESFSRLSTIEQPQYFPHDIFHLHPHETFVDGGAFTGDSLQVFLKESACKFRSIVAIEPDPANNKTLQEEVASLDSALEEKITTVQCALGDHQGTVAFAASGSTQSAIGESGDKVPLQTLDNLLVDETPTLIKLDIEGAERAALIGASKTIRRHQPILAICLYHRPEDIWKIPLQITAINPSYRIYIRRHGGDGVEMVCYALPAERA